jgi:hypothetical protein
MKNKQEERRERKEGKVVLVEKLEQKGDFTLRQLGAN